MPKREGKGREERLSAGRLPTCLTSKKPSINICPQALFTSHLGTDINSGLLGGSVLKQGFSMFDGLHFPICWSSSLFPHPHRPAHHLPGFLLCGSMAFAVKAPGGKTSRGEDLFRKDLQIPGVLKRIEHLKSKCSKTLVTLQCLWRISWPLQVQST